MTALLRQRNTEPRSSRITQCGKIKCSMNIFICKVLFNNAYSVFKLNEINDHNKRKVTAVKIVQNGSNFTTVCAAPGIFSYVHHN